MNKVEKNLVKKIILFIIGLLNIVPNEINLYERIVNIVEKSTDASNTFYIEIVILIWLFRGLILIFTLYELAGIVKYIQRHTEK